MPPSRCAPSTETSLIRPKGTKIVPPPQRDHEAERARRVVACQRRHHRRRGSGRWQGRHCRSSGRPLSREVKTCGCSSPPPAVCPAAFPTDDVTALALIDASIGPAATATRPSPPLTCDQSRAQPVSPSTSGIGVAAPSAVNRGRLDPQPVHPQPTAGLADQHRDQVTARRRGHRGGQLRALAARHHRDRREAARPVGATGGAARNGAADRPGQPDREQRASDRDRGEHRRAARIAHGHDRDRAFLAGLPARPERGPEPAHRPAGRRS